MKQLSVKSSFIRLRISIITLILVIISLFLFSFTTRNIADEFFSQLGISKTNADEKITNSLLGGYLDEYGVSSAKKIVLGKRAAVVKDLLNYTKKHVNSTSFVKGYNEMRASYKPTKNPIQTPQEMREQTIEQYKKSITQTEASLKKADGSLKKMFEDLLAANKQQLKQAEDSTNKYYVNYKKNYPQMVQSNEAGYSSQLQKWEKQYPANHLLFVKERLQQFLTETADIDFDAALVEKNGKKYFINKEYERKGNRWKMAFRAGKDAIGTAREMVQQWINEIN
jgi:hypothetical protein